MYFYTRNFRGYTLFESAGLFQSTEGWIHPARSLPSYELILMVDGSFSIAVGGTVYTLSSGDFAILPAQTLHEGAAPAESPTRFYWIHFLSKELLSTDSRADLRRELLSGDINRVLVLPQFTSQLNMHGLYAMCNHLLHINQVQVSPLYRNNYMNTILHEISYQTLSHLEQESLPVNKLQPVQDWIRVHACEPITLDQIARQFEYNKSYLSRKYKKEMGLGISEQILLYRMEKARWLLSSTSMTIQEVAYNVGYNDPKYFMRVFKQAEQNTPSDYRRAFDQRHFNQE